MKRYFSVIALALILTLLVAACGDDATATPTSAPAPTAAPTSPSPTVVAVSPTAKPEPTTKPEPTAMPKPTATLEAMAKPEPTPVPTLSPTPIPEPIVTVMPGPVTVETDTLLMIALQEQTNSGQSGWAVLTANGDETEVALTLSAGAMESELVHIHSGSCGDDTLGGIVHGLSSFVDGSGASVSTVAATLASLRTGNFAINTHKAGDPGVYTSCGNIPATADTLSVA